MNKKFSIKVINRLGDVENVAYLHGDEAAIKSFSTWLEKLKDDKNCYIDSSSIIIGKKSLNDFLLEALMCGLRPTRAESIFPA